MRLAAQNVVQCQLSVNTLIMAGSAYWHSPPLSSIAHFNHAITYLFSHTVRARIPVMRLSGACKNSRWNIQREFFCVICCSGCVLTLRPWSGKCRAPLQPQRALRSALRSWPVRRSECPLQQPIRRSSLPSRKRLRLCSAGRRPR